MDSTQNYGYRDEHMSRETETKNESNGSSRNQKHCNKMKNALDELISRVDTAKRKASVSLKIHQ